MPATRKQKQKETRDRLVAAAHDSIIQDGVSALSIRSICSAAGHSQGAFYSNFSDKDDLLADILQTHIRDEVVLLRRLLAQCEETGVDETLDLLGRRLAALAAEPQWSQLSVELQLHARRDPDFAERHRAGKAACYAVFADLISDLADRFGIQPVLPPLQTGIGLYALWMGLAVQGEVEGAVPRHQMLVGFFRALMGLGVPGTERA